MKIDNVFNKKPHELTEVELEQAIEVLVNAFNLRNTSPIQMRNVMIEAQGIDCPHCSHSAVKIHERTKRLRFKCQNCFKTFTSTQGTAIHGIHSLEKWKHFIPLFLQSKSIRFIAGELKISARTSFDWRHKALSALTAQQSIKSVSGIVELDDKMFDLNLKGCRHLDRAPLKRTSERKNRGKFGEKVTVLVVHERIQNRTEMRVVQRGRIRKETLSNQIEPKAKSIICTDMHRCFTAWSKDNNLPCAPIKASAKQFENGIYHL